MSEHAKQTHWPPPDSALVTLGAIGRHLRNAYPDFDQRTYGYAKLSDLIRVLGQSDVQNLRAGRPGANSAQEYQRPTVLGEFQPDARYRPNVRNGPVADLTAPELQSRVGAAVCRLERGAHAPLLDRRVTGMRWRRPGAFAS